MAGKAKRDKGKRHLQSKKGRAKMRAGMAIAQQPEAVSEPAAVKREYREASAPAPKAAALKPEQARYRYVTAELKHIGVLSVIILVILVVLAVVLK